MFCIIKPISDVFETCLTPLAALIFGALVVLAHNIVSVVD